MKGQSHRSLWSTTELASDLLALWPVSPLLPTEIADQRPFSSTRCKPHVLSLTAVYFSRLHDDTHGVCLQELLFSTTLKTFLPTRVCEEDVGFLHYGCLYLVSTQLGAGCAYSIPSPLVSILATTWHSDFSPARPDHVWRALVLLVAGATVVRRPEELEAVVTSNRPIDDIFPGIIHVYRGWCVGVVKGAQALIITPFVIRTVASDFRSKTSPNSGVKREKTPVRPREGLESAAGANAGMKGRQRHCTARFPLDNPVIRLGGGRRARPCEDSLDGVWDGVEPGSLDWWVLLPGGYLAGPPAGWSKMAARAAIIPTFDSIDSEIKREYFEKKHLRHDESRHTYHTTVSNRNIQASPFIVLIPWFELYKITFFHRGRGDIVVRPLASHLGEPGLIPGFSHVNDNAGRRVFLGISRFPRPFIPVLIHTHLTSPTWALQTSLLRAPRPASALAEQLACSPPTKAIQVQFPAGPLRIFARGNRAGRCRWPANFLEVLPFPPPFHSGAAPYSPQSPSSDLDETSRC
ncbi:hypothetical protein PR048_017133 [Dryococelus australis]|uniref:Uncharacterized protein n=1 Tax=Dryococelus australis TaxID=614101 RepID=A0ABQ9H8P2_9NEOP|nr:hypothetical protein PR048_017133 [Dryococelus australis]